MFWYDWIFWAILALGFLLIMAYGFVLLFGAPYLPTMKKQREQALDLLDLRPGQVFFDLGSGDGAMLIEAGKRGLNAVGYEINPFLVLISWVRTRRFGRRVKIKFRSFWRADLSSADGVFVFLITHRMEQFDEFLKAKANKRSLKVVSHAFEIPGKKPIKKSGPMFLYKY